MVQDIVAARQAWQTHRVTAAVAIGFWIAYANLSKLTRPVTAASLLACEAASLRGEKIRATILVLIIIVFSVFLFMNNSTANETAELIEQQNAAALKLWANLQILRSSAAEQSPAASHAPSTLESQSGTAFVNRAFEDAVEFSRRSQQLLQSASKLHFWFNPWWTNIDVGSVRFDKDNPDGITHLLISPGTSQPNEIQAEVEEIRDQGVSSSSATTHWPWIKPNSDHIRRDHELCRTAYSLCVAGRLSLRLPAACSRLIRRKTYLALGRAQRALLHRGHRRPCRRDCSARCCPRTSPCHRLPWRSSSVTRVEAFFSRLDDLIAKSASAIRRPSQPQRWRIRRQTDPAPGADALLRRRIRGSLRAA